MNIGIYIYDQAEVLDFSGPYEVFATASRVCPDENPFAVFLIGDTGHVVTARSGYLVIPNYGFENCPNVDVLIVAGGVHEQEEHKHHVIDWLGRRSRTAIIVASVCTGAFLLAEAGLLDNRNVTTHWEDIHTLQEGYPKLIVRRYSRWIDEGTVVTSGGISAGIDMSLHLVGRLHSKELARKTARQMECFWEERDGSSIVHLNDGRFLYGN